MELILAMIIVGAYEWYKYKKKHKPVAAEPNVVPPESKPAPAACSFCGDEDIFLAGTKEKLPCPTCKRNGSKIKAG